MFGLTSHQAATLRFIRGFVAQHGYSPSYDEIAHGVGLKAKSGAHRLVHGLVERGHLVLKANYNRSVALVEAA